MAKIDFGGVEEEVVTRGEFPLEKAREVLKDEGGGAWLRCAGTRTGNEYAR